KIAPGPRPDMVLVSAEHLRKRGKELTQELEGRLRLTSVPLLFRVGGNDHGKRPVARIEGYAAKEAVDRVLGPLAPYVVRDEEAAEALDDLELLSVAPDSDGPDDPVSVISW